MVYEGYSTRTRLASTGNAEDQSLGYKRWLCIKWNWSTLRTHTQEEKD